MTNEESKGADSASVSTDGLCVLRLTLKRKWFDMIASGEKREEYREMKPYWHKRLMCSKRKFDAIHFRNGYSRNARSMTVELRELRSGLGIVEWGSPEGQEVYILCLGKILQTHNDNVTGLAPEGD